MNDIVPGQSLTSLVVVGTGLVGGSFALAARKQGLFRSIIGIDANPEHAKAALAAGLVDELLPVDAPLPAHAGVMLAVHPSAIPGWVVRLKDHPQPVTDVGSLKHAVITLVREELGTLPRNFVPGHPVAGSENSGPNAAVEGLFVGKTVVLTPEPETDAAAVANVRLWWSSIGAQVQVLSAEDHDRMLAFTSHLPHLVAFALMANAQDAHFDFVGGGFRDFTRIAGSDPGLWVDIFRSNREALLAQMTEFETIFASARRALVADDAQTLRALLDRANGLRRRLETALAERGG